MTIIVHPKTLQAFFDLRNRNERVIDSAFFYKIVKIKKLIYGTRHSHLFQFTHDSR